MIKRVFVTGMSLLSAAGIGLLETLDSLKNNTYIHSREEFPKEPYLVKGKMKPFDAKKIIKNKKAVRNMGNRTIYGCCAANMAVADNRTRCNGNRYIEDEDKGVIFGGAIAQSIFTIKDAIIKSLNADGKLDYESLGLNGYRALPPLDILKRLPNSVAGQICIENQMKGLSTTVVNGLSNGMIALGEAYEKVANCNQSYIVCGCSEGDIYIDYLVKLDCLGIGNTEEIKCIPYPVSGNGSIISEGAAAFVFQNELKDEKKVYGEILAYENRYISNIKEKQASDISKDYLKVMDRAIKTANIRIDELSFVQAGGTGQQKIDTAEALALEALVGNRVPITAAYPYTGFPLTVMGCMSFGFALLQLNYNFLGAIPIERELYCGNKLDFVRNKNRWQKNRYSLVNQADASGNISCFILKRGA